MSSLSRDELVTALRAHRNNDVYVSAAIYAGDDPQDLTTEIRRLAITGLLYDSASGCLLIDATEDYD